MGKEFIEMPKLTPFGEHILLKKEKENNNTAFFENGLLIDVSPRNKEIPLYQERDIAYGARYIVSDGVKYDMYSTYDLINFIIPDTHYTPLKNYFSFDDEKGKKEESGLGFGLVFEDVTRYLGYILEKRIKCIFSKELIIPLAYKTVNILINEEHVSRDTLDRIVIQLYAIGADDYADYLDSELKKKLDIYKVTDYSHKFQFDEAIRIAKECVNQVEIPYQYCACGECAKYMGRIYSLDGSDNRFPRLPQFIIDNKQIHDGCRCSIHSTIYFEGAKLYKYTFKNDGGPVQEPVDAIESSNRPFVDDRCEEAKIHYERVKEKERIEKENKEKGKWSIQKWKEWGEKNIEYEWLEEYLPDICPKNMASYTKAKKANSKKYLLLKEEALKLGMVLKDDEPIKNESSAKNSLIHNDSAEQKNSGMDTYEDLFSLDKPSEQSLSNKDQTIVNTLMDFFEEK